MQPHRLLLLAVLALPALAFAQGLLTPPGAPTPTMKSLDQIEARTPVQPGSSGVSANANGGFTISAPGSYYLAGNLTVASGDGIVITADNVTLDLNGFTIAGTGYLNLGDAVLINGVRANIAIRNGHIVGATTCDTSTHIFSPGGFRDGVSGQSAYGTCTVSDVTVLGVARAGIYLSLSSNLVRSCAVQVCGGGGITGGTISDCLAVTCGATAIIGVTVQNCTGDASVGPGAGIEAYTAANCWGIAYSGTGIEANVAINCQGTSSSGTGLTAVRTAENCYGETATGTYALSAFESATNCSGNNTTGKAGAYGLYTDGVASGCKGSTPAGAAGLKASIAQNCQGSSTSGTGLRAAAATNCQGTSTSGTGLYAEQTATGCVGTTTTGSDGLYAGTAAENCRGSNTNGTGMSYGLRVSGAATGCNGFASTGQAGLSANVALNCEGNCPNGKYGLLAYQSATNCSGYIGSTSNTTAASAALRAAMATGCYGENLSTLANTYGLYATVSAHNSTGGGVIGIYAARSANYCNGVSTGSASPVAISTPIAIGCTGTGTITGAHYITP